jgi:hypothetical protein
MIKAEILEALPKLNAEERREIRAKLNELDRETWFDNGDLSEQGRVRPKPRRLLNFLRAPARLEFGGWISTSPFDPDQDLHCGK